MIIFCRCYRLLNWNLLCFSLENFKTKQIISLYRRISMDSPSGFFLLNNPVQHIVIQFDRGREWLFWITVCSLDRSHIHESYILTHFVLIISRWFCPLGTTLIFWPSQFTWANLDAYWLMAIFWAPSYKKGKWTQQKL